METSRFDIADYLDNKEMALSDGAKPQFATIMKVLKAIGGQIRINPKTA